MEAVAPLGFVLFLFVVVSGIWFLASTLASKEDVKGVRNEVRELRREVKSDIAGLRNDAKELQKDVQNTRSSLEELLATPPLR
jgi:hypothetical protein